MECKLAVSRFATRFGNELDRTHSGVCSPLSAQTVLALTALGSGGDTRLELLRAMALPDDDAIRSLFGYLTSTLNSVKSVKVRFANRVYVSKAGTLKPAILKDSLEVFGSGIQQVDFLEKESVAESINDWVAEVTNNMIKNVISPDALEDGTRLLLVNAIYFHGSWERPFECYNTKERTFDINNETKIQVPMMFMNEEYLRYRHSPELKSQLLQMNYRGLEASMIFLVPDEVEGLSSVMEQLAGGHDLLAEVAELRSTRIEAMVPKFKIETKIDLKEVLPKIGIRDIFDKETSDIRMFMSDERMFVSQAFQTAVIEVDELGTEAAAATLCDIQDICAIIPLHPPKRFVADRPFAYVLLVRGIPVFLGTYTDISHTAGSMDVLMERLQSSGLTAPTTDPF